MNDDNILGQLVYMFFFGMFWAWVMVWIYRKLCQWWMEGGLTVEVLEPNDPQVQQVKPVAKWWKE